jgi:micrococcal nuclease
MQRSSVSLALLLAAVSTAGLPLAQAQDSVVAARAVAAVSESDSVQLRASAEAMTRMTACAVTDVVDGDTFRCGDLGRVRLLLIDSPERDQEPYGTRSREALVSLLPVGSQALLERDVQPRDQYGRLLAYVYRSDGLQVNEMMIRSGFAVVVTYPPNVRHVDPMRRALELARAERRGLWSTEAFTCEPRDHRAGRCE